MTSGKTVAPEKFIRAEDAVLAAASVLDCAPAELLVLESGLR